MLAAGGQKFADNVVAFTSTCAAPSLCVYAIVRAIDRSKPAHKQSDPALYAGVVRGDDGIVISGAQQLATGGAISDVIHLSCINRCSPATKLRQLPGAVNAPGLKLYQRPFAMGDEFVRLSALGVSTRPTATSFDGVFVPMNGSSSTATSKSRAINGGRRRRISR